jgi:hypothetical protein
MSKRSSVLVLVLAAVMGVAGDIPTIARSTCRMHRYFEGLKSANAPVTSFERLLISLILAHSPEITTGKS